MKSIGLTGGIGMGKSTAAAFLATRGVVVVDTDDLARALVRPNQPTLHEIVVTFGKQILTPSGELNRTALAAVVFADAAKRQQLEAILHPRIRELWEAQMERWRTGGHSLAVVVIPLLFETAAESSFDAVICVACSAATQRERLRDRGWTSEQIAQREAAQLPVAEKMARAQFVVWSEGRKLIMQQQLQRVLGI